MQAFERLEIEVAKWNGLEPDNVVSCSSGSAALHLAWEALRLPQASSVICGDYNMIACPRSISMAGLVPQFVDCDERLLMDLDKTDHILSGWPKIPDDPNQYVKEGNITGILATHVYGRRIDMDALHMLASKYDLAVVEDLAEAHGVRPHAASDAACWSFQRTKVVHGEEGGAVWFRQKRDADLARSLKDCGFNADRDYVHVPRAMNYRLANCLAVKVLESLNKVECNLSKRRRIEGWYQEALDKHSLDWVQPPRDSVWCYDIRVPGMAGEVQDRVVRELKAAGIHARHGFKICSGQQEYFNRACYSPQALAASREVICLPCDPESVSRLDVEQAFRIISSALGAVPPAA